jgi:AcrR family transcriptional regulator
VLDAARALVLGEGVGRATVRAIAARAGAPMGTLYHRFSSREALLAAMWLRAVRRSQADFIRALAHEDPLRAAVGAALSIVAFCEREPEDAQLLVTVRREDLVTKVDAELRRELESVNRPVSKLLAEATERLFGRRTAAEKETMMLALFDLPYGAVRRHLIARRPIPAQVPPAVAKAVEAVLRDAKARLPG